MPKINGHPHLSASPLAPVVSSKPTARPVSSATPTVSAAPTEKTLWESDVSRATSRLSFLEDDEQLSPQTTLLLMSLRDELSRRRSELSHTFGPEFAPEIELDLNVISQATEMVNEALASTRDLPTNLLSDLTHTLTDLVSAEPGKALEHLYRPQGLSQEVNVLARTLADQSRQEIPDLHAPLANAIDGYTQIAGAVESVLPKMPFPVTLPVPIVYDDGNTAFVLPPGSQVSSQSNGGYEVSTPGFMVLNEGSQILGRDIRLSLGEDFDGLQLGALTVNTEDSNTYLAGVDAGISRQDQSAIIAADTVRYDGDSGQFLLENARIRQHTMGTEAGFSQLQWDEGSLGQTEIKQHVTSEAAYLDFNSQDLSYANGEQWLTAETLAFQLEQGSEGQRLYGSGTQLSFTEAGTEGAVRHFEAASADINIINEANGAGQVSLTGSDLSYQEGAFSLSTEGQSGVNLSRNADGFVDNLTVQGNRLQYQNQNDRADLHGARTTLSFDTAGQITSVAGSLDSGQLHGNFGRAALQGGALSLQYEQGTLSAINGDVAQIQFKNQENAIDLHGLGLAATFNPDGSLHSSNVELGFGEIMTSDVQADFFGLQAQFGEAQSSLHIDSAQVKAQLEAEWDVKVENLDLILQEGNAGQGQSLDLAVGNSEALVSGLHAQVRTQNGDQVRVHLELSEDGSFLQEAFLQIPEGGEIQLQQEELNLRLGGGDAGQRLSFSQDGQGLYTFTGTGLDMDASTQDSQVSIRGGNAQISVDSQRGDLIIEDITGVGIDATVAGQNIQIDLQEMDGFLVKATGISGLAEGAALHLIPTEHDSVIQAEIRTEYNGIPLRVKLDDVHELKALASVQTNRAHVYFGDPSGQGNVELNAGPLTMKGSAIEWTAQYHSFSPERMMNNVSRALSSEGFEIAPGIQIEADGVVRLQTPFENGPHAGLTLLFPRPEININTDNDLYGNLPVRTSAPQDGSVGAIAEIGWTNTNEVGARKTLGFHAGVVPGSFINLKQNQGSTYIGDFKLPTNNISLPTTAIAGVTFRSHDSDKSLANGTGARTDFMAGGYLNPAGLVDSPYISEGDAYGLYAGVEHRKNNMFVGAGTTVGLSGDNPNVGAQIRFGISF